MTTHVGMGERASGKGLRGVPLCPAIMVQSCAAPFCGFLHLQLLLGVCV